MGIDHAAQSAKVIDAMRDSGYEVVYNDGGPQVSSPKHTALESNSHKLHAAEEAEKVRIAIGDISGKRINYAGGIKRV